MLVNSEGKNIPSIVFRTIASGVWKNVSTEDLFKGKNVVVFSLPGAFTPTCSSAHVPRYEELWPLFKANGIDSIVCISVNDTFVMNSWKSDQKAENVIFIPDGNCEFTTKMGMAVDKTNLGFGTRSWRYSMLVKDQKIEKMFIEPDVEGDPFQVSDADTMLKYINPKVSMPKDVTIFTKRGCPFCAKAKEMLSAKSWPYEEIVLGENATVRSLRAVCASTTVPQVYIDGKLIGGSTELEQFLK
eukprot:Platyproteum_vivax@DN4201_c0_g1_i1.p1